MAQMGIGVARIGHGGSHDYATTRSDHPSPWESYTSFSHGSDVPSISQLSRHRFGTRSRQDMHQNSRVMTMINLHQDSCSNHGCDNCDTADNSTLHDRWTEGGGGGSEVEEETEEIIHGEWITLFKQ